MSDDRQPLLLAYLGSWGDWRADSIDASQLTHLCYAFALIKDGQVVSSDDPTSAERLKELSRLRARCPHLKTLVSIGGWAADGFSDAALTEQARQKLTRSAVAFMQAHGFDGLDLDWEYPSSDMAGIKARPEDRQNFTLLLEDMRQALDALSHAEGRTGSERFLLTIAAGAAQSYLDGIEPKRVGELVDFINLMTYDLYNGWSKVSGHHANLFGSAADPAGDSADNAVKLFVEHGVPASKLVLGAAFYGRGLTGVASKANGLMQAATPGSNFVKSYAEIKRELLAKPAFQRFWDDVAKAPWLYDGDTFVSYEDPESLRHKAEYVRRRGLRGVMFWEYCQDSDGELLTALRRALRDNAT